MGEGRREERAVRLVLSPSLSPHRAVFHPCWGWGHRIHQGSWSLKEATPHIHGSSTVVVLWVNRHQLQVQTRESLLKRTLVSLCEGAKLVLSHDLGWEGGTQVLRVSGDLV